MIEPRSLFGQWRAYLLSAIFALISHHGFSQEFIIKIKPQASFSKASFASLAQAIPGLKIKDQHQTGHLVLVSLPDGDVRLKAEALADMLKLDYIDYVVPNVIFHAVTTPNDPQYGQQWALKKVNAEQAWDLSKGNKNIVVAVIDTGVDSTHEDLKSSIWVNSKEIPGNGVDDDHNGFIDDSNGWDFRDNDNLPMDLTSERNPGHGTHCAGIIAASGDNGIGISGIAPQISIMPVRFLGADGSGDLMTAAKAIDYAVANGAHVISASWGAPAPRAQVTPILEAIERARDKGVVFVAAAANDGRSNDTREVYPANAGFSNMISVAASDPNDAKPQWSNFGKHKVDLASPGLNIFSTLPNNNYGNLSGTSMATPLVAGLVALMLDQSHTSQRQLAPQDLKAILQATGAQVEIETACQCRIAADEALKNISKGQLTVVPNALTLEPSGSAKFSATGGQGPFTFESSNPQVATMASDGTLTGKAEGETLVTITDSLGAKAVSKKIFLAKPSEGGGQACPFQEPMLCDILCQIEPTLPWCH